MYRHSYVIQCVIQCVCITNAFVSPSSPVPSPLSPPFSPFPSISSFLQPFHTHTHTHTPAKVEQDMILDGLNILKHHCVVVNRGGNLSMHNVKGAKTYVNGVECKGDDPVELHHGHRLILGNNHAFR